MDAHAVLERVGAAYARLKTLSADIVVTTVSGDENAPNRSEKRSRGWYSAPNLVRIEQGGYNPLTIVQTAKETFSYFARAGRYGRAENVDERLRVGSFLPEWPGASIGQVFLFQRIAERVRFAEAAEDNSRAVRVAYEDAPVQSPHSFTPPLFWIAPDTGLIQRMEISMTFRLPDRPTVHHSRQTISFRNLRIDEPIPDETFELTPAVGATVTEPGIGVFTVSASGRGGRSSREWESGALIERSQYTFNGIGIRVARRMEPSGDGKELVISEEYEGPAGVTRREFRVPMTAGG